MTVSFERRQRLYSYEPACRDPETGRLPFRSPPQILFKSWAPWHLCNVDELEMDVDGSILTPDRGRVRWMGPPYRLHDHTVDPPQDWWVYPVRCTLCGLEDEILSPIKLCVGGTARECQELGLDFSRELERESLAEDLFSSPRAGSG